MVRMVRIVNMLRMAHIVYMAGMLCVLRTVPLGRMVYTVRVIHGPPAAHTPCGCQMGG